MRKLIRLLLICASVSVLYVSQTALAQVDRTLEGDKKCTICHDENWTTPVLSIYQTKHGVKGDGRTPGCQGCHGASTEHMGDPGGKAPDVVFGAKSKKLSTTEERNAACLCCHESKVLPRSQWSGSQHEMHGLACTDCHELHTPNQRVLNKLTQPEVCCQVPQGAAGADSSLSRGTRSWKAKSLVPVVTTRTARQARSFL